MAQALNKEDIRIGTLVGAQSGAPYIKQILPRWDTTFPRNYRVDVELNGSPRKVLRAAPMWRPPILRFRFFDSALSMGNPACYGAGESRICPAQ